MRKTTWLTDLKQVETVIHKAKSCCIAMIDNDGKPYVVTMNFGFKNGVFYFHGDKKGKKMDCLKANPHVSITLSVDHRLFYQNQQVACSYGLSYRSVCVQGIAEMIDNQEQKIEALEIIMAQYSKDNFKFNAPSVNNVAVFKVKADDLKCKEYGTF